MYYVMVKGGGGGEGAQTQSLALPLKKIFKKGEASWSPLLFTKSIVKPLSKEHPENQAKLVQGSLIRNYEEKAFPKSGCDLTSGLSTHHGPVRGSPTAPWLVNYTKPKASHQTL